MERKNEYCSPSLPEAQNSSINIAEGRRILQFGSTSVLHKSSGRLDPVSLLRQLRPQQPKPPPFQAFQALARRERRGLVVYGQGNLSQWQTLAITLNSLDGGLAAMLGNPLLGPAGKGLRESPQRGRGSSRYPLGPLTSGYLTVPEKCHRGAWIKQQTAWQKARQKTIKPFPLNASFAKVLWCHKSRLTLVARCLSHSWFCSGRHDLLGSAWKSHFPKFRRDSWLPKHFI